ncbi:unnamed protein product, partial [Rotaria sp. Silwood1]
MNTHGRYKPELMSVIGMFANAIPLRCQLDPSWSFARLVEEVHQIATDSSNYSYFPLQRILAQHPLASKPTFLDTSFQFGSSPKENICDEIIFGDVHLSRVPFSFKIGTDEVVIGIVSIEMVGGAYCPLSPENPDQRLLMLLKQTRCRLVLVHFMTQDRFSGDIITVDIDAIINNDDIVSSSDSDRLLCSMVTSDCIAAIVFTSGSTGIPKAVQLRHGNLVDCIQSLKYLNMLNQKDITIQLAQCSFDAHLLEILGALILGATIIMLRRKGNMDLMYLATVLSNKQVSYMFAVPTLLNSLCDLLDEVQIPHLHSMRSLCAGGEIVSPKLAERIKSNVTRDCLIWHVYGPAETTIFSTYHQVNSTYQSCAIPLGQPLPNYRCLIHDEFGQHVIIGQEGELLVGGVGVFFGYIDRDDLTEKALVKIDGAVYYRTGDLVRIDSSGLIYYIGRKDYQVKLHGQRIEVGEIERCLLDSHISACVVVKWGDDHLVAYVKGSGISEEDLRTHCRSRLPPFMIPSMFIVLNQLPLNANGKVDRKRLPVPDFSSLSTSTSNTYNAPHTEMEERVHNLWCEVLQTADKKISTTSGFFTIGGHSLLFIKLYHHYQSSFGFDSHTLSITPFLQQATIAEHAKLLETINFADVKSKAWPTLHISE